MDSWQYKLSLTTSSITINQPTITILSHHEIQIPVISICHSQGGSRQIGCLLRCLLTKRLLATNWLCTSKHFPHQKLNPNLLRFCSKEITENPSTNVTTTSGISHRPMYPTHRAEHPRSLEPRATQKTDGNAADPHHQSHHQDPAERQQQQRQRQQDGEDGPRCRSQAWLVDEWRLAIFSLYHGWCTHITSHNKAFNTINTQILHG